MAKHRARVPASVQAMELLFSAVVGICVFVPTTIGLHIAFGWFW